MSFVMFRKLLNFLINNIVFLTCDLDVVGVEKIPSEGGCIITANHLGRLDAILVYAIIRREDIILTIAEKYKKSLLFRSAAKSLNGIWIDRFNPDIKALREVLYRLQKGGIFVIAPEGTRSETEKLMEGKLGAAYLGAKTLLPIFPVGVVGTEDRIVKSRIKKLSKSRISIKVGDPFFLPRLPKKNRNRFLNSYTDEIMCQIGRLLPPKYHGFYATNARLKELLEADKVNHEQVNPR
jgi:1-acyl-sn-glycerol-3-phosphate acyltransferase